MSLSSYACICFNNDGNFCEAIINGFEKNSKAYIRKTNIVIEKNKKVLALLNSGDVTLDEFRIIAIRKNTPQDALYFIIKVTENVKYDWRYRLWKFFWRSSVNLRKINFFYNINKKINSKWNKYIKPKSYFITGISCYGYDNCYERFVRKMGIPEAEIREAEKEGEEASTYTGQKPIEGKPGEYSYHIGILAGDRRWEVNVTKEELNKLDCQWVGILSETLQDYFIWLEKELKNIFMISKEERSKYLEKLKNGAHIQYNQGDAFIAYNLGIDIPTSAVGKPIAPIIEQITSQKSE